MIKAILAVKCHSKNMQEKKLYLEFFRLPLKIFTHQKVNFQIQLKDKQVLYILIFTVHSVEWSLFTNLSSKIVSVSYGVQINLQARSKL